MACTKVAEKDLGNNILIYMCSGTVNLATSAKDSARALRSPMKELSLLELSSQLSIALFVLPCSTLRLVELASVPAVTCATFFGVAIAGVHPQTPPLLPKPARNGVR